MTNDEIEIDLLKILKTWLKKAWIIVLVAAVLGGGLFAYGKAAHVPVYTATTTLSPALLNLWMAMPPRAASVKPGVQSAPGFCV